MELQWESLELCLGIDDEPVESWSWLLGEVPEEWKEASVNPALKKGKKEDLGSCQPVSSSILLDVLMKYRLDKGKVRWTES
ncbi:hypothetical protein QYF61_003439 [Mycteria americana]|uniref:Uncharacterized protein n=1 Tax=Mycteria americana TaxID=33587 RepID=A0AAN7RG47_MYCAM|nr:hypothetical protein QYF61_003439 [Mycteria americana]